jgi:hypothetical protein
MPDLTTKGAKFTKIDHNTPESFLALLASSTVKSILALRPGLRCALHVWATTSGQFNRRGEFDQSPPRPLFPPTVHGETEPGRSCLEGAKSVSSALKIPLGLVYN